jgi:tRNA modification GTPase
MSNATTIAAIATAPGLAGVAIVRLSGPDSWAIARRLFSKPDTLKTGRIAYGWVMNGSTPVDEVIVLPFKAPRSFTGEDVIEIQCHGGQQVPHQVLALCLQYGAEPSPPGEFTRRSFLNGKLDLTQAEAIADLIAAEGQGLAQAASHQLHAKGLATRIHAMRQAILPIQAAIVACTDYPDEVDEPDRAPLLAQLSTIMAQAQVLHTASSHNQLLREGLRVAILGQPNAGKSSLFNALLSRDRAIVTAIAGTTRDTLAETVTVSGVPLTLLDTAGIRDTLTQSDADTVEALGIERSWQAAHSAQAIVYLIDSTTLAGLPVGHWPELDQDHLTHLPPTVPCLIVATKTDLLTPEQHKALPGVVLPLSSVTGQGMTDIWQWLDNTVQQGLASAPQDRFITLNHRQTECLTEAMAQLKIAHSTLEHPALPIDVVTVPLSQALVHLDALTGFDTTEDVLEQVFRRFCVGK